MYQKKLYIFVSFIIVIISILLYSNYQLRTQLQHQQKVLSEKNKIEKKYHALLNEVFPFKNEYRNEEVFERPENVPISSTSAKVKIPIIMYHYVEYVEDEHDTMRKKLDIQPHILDKQLQILKANGYDTYFVKDVPDILNKKIYYSPKSIILTFDDGYEDFYTEVYPLLKKYRVRATVYIIHNYIGRKGFMTKAQIQEVSNSGLVEIGSHSLNHLQLKTVSEAVARKEVIQSKTLLEKMFNIKIESFAYPSGSFSLQTVEIVKEAGYVVAVSTISGSYQSKDDMFYLLRLRAGLLSPDSMIATLEGLKK